MDVADSFAEGVNISSPDAVQPPTPSSHTTHAVPNESIPNGNMNKGVPTGPPAYVQNGDEGTVYPASENGSSSRVWPPGAPSLTTPPQYPPVDAIPGPNTVPPASTQHIPPASTQFVPQRDRHGYYLPNWTPPGTPPMVPTPPRTEMYIAPVDNDAITIPRSKYEGDQAEIQRLRLEVRSLKDQLWDEEDKHREELRRQKRELQNKYEDENDRLRDENKDLEKALEDLRKEVASTNQKIGQQDYEPPVPKRRQAKPAAPRNWTSIDTSALLPDQDSDLERPEWPALGAERPVRRSVVQAPRLPPQRDQPPLQEGLVECPMGCDFIGPFDDVQVHILTAHPELYEDQPTASDQVPAEGAGSSSGSVPEGPKKTIRVTFPDNKSSTFSIAQSTTKQEMNQKLVKECGRPRDQIRVMMGGKFVDDADDDTPWMSIVPDFLANCDTIAIVVTYRV